MNSKLEHKLRLYSGLFIAFFLVLHLLNAALGIISLAAMDALSKILFAIWSMPIFGVLLYSALIVHVGLMFVTLIQRSSLRMPAWNMLQFATALVMPLLLIGHIAATRGTYEILDIHNHYTSVVSSLWSQPVGIAKQYALMGVAWMHMSVGIHYWLRHKRGYTRWIPVLYPLCLVIPLLASLGFLVAGLESQQLTADSPVLQKVQQAIVNADLDSVNFLIYIETSLLWIFALLLIAVLIFRSLRAYWERSRDGYLIFHTPTGKQLPGRGHQTILDTLREAGIQHASVCGGRGRCTTCRVKITACQSSLPEPGELEMLALQRIGAEPGVRLACQLRPQQNISITPLLHPDTSTPVAGVMGHEQQITCLFVDMRDSTRLGEEKLPYDVVFIHNQFFKQLADALKATNGHYATFNGDGLMALYGLDSDLESGCRQALEGVVEIWQRIEKLNLWLAAELKTPIRVGIGIHCGYAIVGTMGPPDSPTISALGDIVNITARLEALTKEYNTGLIVSKDVLRNIGANYRELSQQTVYVRGREKPLDIFTVNDSIELINLLQDVDQRRGKHSS